MKTKMGRSTAALLAVLLLLTGCSQPGQTSESEILTANTGEMKFSFTDRELDGNWSISEAVAVGDLSQPINSAGTYLLQGSYTGTLTVDAGESDKIQLVLDGAQIHCPDGPAVYIANADKVFISLAEGSENSISDGPDYSEAALALGADAAVFSRADLAINGSGSLSICGNYAHAAESKDDLCITAAKLSITAVKAGLKGKDCVRIKGTQAEICAGSDAVRSDNSEDSARGYVYIDSAALEIEAGRSGIQAETVLKVCSSRLNILSGGGSAASTLPQEGSFKGMEAGVLVQIDGGEYIVDSLDDCIHSNGELKIVSGSFSLSSADDGVHADGELDISGGKLDIHKSYEGLEASVISISGGELSVTASDDGLNAAGGNDLSANEGPFGPGSFLSSTGEIFISGGYLHVNSGGDGIDSNGSLEISGGTVLVSGPVSGGNSVLDYAQQAVVKGGTLLAVGSREMAQSVAAEGQGVVACSFGRVSGGTGIVVADSGGRAVLAYTPPKDYECAVLSSPGIVSGESYSIIIGAGVSGADSFGFAQSCAFSGGTVLGSIEADSGSSMGSGAGPGGMPGHGGMGGGPGGPGPGRTG